METFEKIRALLAEQLDVDPAKITMDMKMAVTTEKPAAVPPAAAQIVDLGSLDAMMNSLAGATGAAA